MELVFLGTGTSHGVPMIGCDCPVCTSNDPRNHRTRTSAFLNVDGIHLLIDTAPELRLQAIREHITRVDALLFTHSHADHLFGLDDVRRFNDLGGNHLRCYGSGETLKTIRRAFEYVFVPTQIGGGKPALELVEVTAPFTVDGLEVTPIPIWHGAMPVLGYRIGNLAYVTDCSRIPESSSELLSNLDVLVLGVLRVEPHETHFCLDEGLAVVEELAPERAFFTHVSHRMDHETTDLSLPDGVQLAYDGLRISV